MKMTARSEQRVAALHTDLGCGLILFVHRCNRNHATETEENWVEFLKTPARTKSSPHIFVSQNLGKSLD